MHVRQCLPSISCDGCEQDRIYNFCNFPFHFSLKSHYADLGYGGVLSSCFATVAPHARQALPSWSLQSFFWCQRSSGPLPLVGLAPVEHSPTFAAQRLDLAFSEFGHA